MTALRVTRFTPDRAADWNAFVKSSRNGTFLFERGYMDYHADRFADHSLILESEDRVVALLPAHDRPNELVSHGGLTYGGLIVGERARLVTSGHCFDAVVAHLAGSGVRRLVYKTVPYIYHRQPAGEDLHALFLRKAVVHRRDVLLVIDNAERGPVQERRMRSARKAARAGLVVHDSSEYGPYWDVLTENLRSKYGTAPVHTLEEIALLARRFPDNIRLTVCTIGGRVVAGVVVYASERVAHLQYIGSSAEGREMGALDLLMANLIQTWRDRRYFDFGAATEQDGHYVNSGLVEFKEGFGARTVVHDHYTLDIPAQNAERT